MFPTSSTLTQPPSYQIPSPVITNPKVDLDSELRSIQQKDAALWNQLMNLKKHIKDDEIWYVDQHNQANTSVESIIIVQRYDSQGNLDEGGSWIVPHSKENVSQCKNPLLGLENGDHGQLSLTRRSQGMNITSIEMQTLKEKGILLQEGSDFYKITERNICVSVQQLIALI